jgi:tryptophanyl-tRNA synthetase
MAEPKKKRFLSGMRPSGSLHVGHYVGALENWLQVQHEYECYFLIVDWHVMADHVGQVEMIKKNVIEVALDWLAVGLDPVSNSFVIQSQVPEGAELQSLISTLVTVPRLNRNPTLKAEIRQLSKEQGQSDEEAEDISRARVSVAFYNYPISQAADILLPKAHLVPVGDDQLPHIELTREIARDFNRMFGEVFPVPEALIGRVPRLVGLDNNGKMSKSLGNTIELKDPAEVVTRKVMGMYTDPTRLRATDPGHVEGNPVFIYHDIFNPDKEEVGDLKERYVQGKVGDVEVKRKLAAALNTLLEPIRDRRAYYEQHMGEVRDALYQGTQRAKRLAEQTMSEVREAMGLASYFK